MNTIKIQTHLPTLLIQIKKKNKRWKTWKRCTTYSEANDCIKEFWTVFHTIPGMNIQQTAVRILNEDDGPVLQ